MCVQVCMNDACNGLCVSLSNNNQVIYLDIGLCVRLF